MISILLVVADSARARIFSFDKKHRSLEELEDLVYPESRLDPVDRTEKQAGSTHDRVGPGRHRVDPHTSVADVGRLQFARQVAAHLESAVNSNRVDKLVLIAAPKFLGELRDGLDSKILSHVALEIDKDLSKLTPEEILEHLPKYF